MKKILTVLICSCFIYSCTKDEHKPNEGEDLSTVYSSNYEEGLFEVNIETGEATKIIEYYYFEMYDPVYVREKNILVIPGYMSNTRKGFVTINLETHQINEFENIDCYKNFVYDTKRKKMYSSNYDVGLFEINIETGESQLLITYNYWETYKPLYIQRNDVLVIPGAITNDKRGYVIISLDNYEVTEFENIDCYRGFEKDNFGQVYSNNSNKGLYKINLETGISTLVVGYNYYETYQPIFIENKNLMVVPGALSGISYTKTGFLTIDMNSLKIVEFENSDCRKHFVAIP